jgi:hypothetical protein
MKLCAALFFSLLGSSAADAADAMTPNDIKAMFFTGQSFTAATTSGTKIKMTFTIDGKTLREPIGSNVPARSGTWRLDAKGFCTSWDRAKANCFTVVPMSNGRWSVQRVATTIAVTAAIWSK